MGLSAMLKSQGQGAAEGELIAANTTAAIAEGTQTVQLN